jgi:hypothetical protein
VPTVRQLRAVASSHRARAVGLGCLLRLLLVRLLRARRSFACLRPREFGMAFYLRGPPPTTASLAGHDARGEPFFSYARLARECCVLGFLISYVLMAWLLFISVAPSVESVIVANPMTHVSARRGGCGARPHVKVQSGRTGMYWAVRELEGAIIVADEAPPRASVFRIEPVALDAGGANISFAIRHLETLRLLTVNPPGTKGEYMLRLGPLRPETPFDLFTVQSLSVRSNGVGGFINHRDRIHVRAHGNIEPWAPMQVESSTTRIIFRELACENPYLVEDALLGMVHKLKPAGSRARPVAPFHAKRSLKSAEASAASSRRAS